MTIEKRLALSNLYMILVPVLITFLIAGLCVAGIWFTITRSTGVGFEDSEDFFSASQGISTLVEEELSSSAADKKSKIARLSRILDRSSMTLVIYEGSLEYFSYGEKKPEDMQLLKAVSLFHDNGVVSNGERNLYSHTFSVGNKPYRLLLFSSQSNKSYASVKSVVALALIFLAFTIFFSVRLTNRFLTKFVFRKIKDPLDLLAEGEKQLGQGNLEYRLEFTEENEFLPICRAFNEMAMRLQASEKQLIQDENDRKELMADISHDLRSPLTSIQAYVEGLLDGVATDEKKKHSYLMTIKAKAMDIDHMVSQLLAFSQMEFDEYPLHLVSSDLSVIISRFLAEEREHYSAQGLNIVEELVPAVAIFDFDQLRRILSNILGNSIKYCRSGQVDVHISMQETEQEIIVEIADDGPGVKETDLPRLFDVFYRADRSRNNPGTGSGLGLAFVAKAIQKMGGSARAYNAIPHGLVIRMGFKKGKTL
jgi:signal transduction histidine kinase